MPNRQQPRRFAPTLLEGACKTLRGACAPAAKAQVCALLAEVSGRAAGAQDEVGAKGCVEALVGVLQGPAASGLHAAALGALHASCLRHAENTSRMVAAGGLKAAVDAMEASPQQQALQVTGCGLLRNAANSGAAAIKAEIASAGGVRAVIASMKAHIDAAPMQEAGCSALKEIAVRSAGNQESVLSHGGIPVLLRAMETHTGLFSVQTLACGLLRDLAARSEKDQEDVVCRGGAQLTLQAMRSFPESADMQRTGCGALFRMCAGSEEMRTEVAAYGAAKVAMKAADAHQGEPRVLEAAYCLVAELAQDVARDRTTLTNAVHDVLKAVVKHAKSEAVQEAGLRAIQAFAACDGDGFVKSCVLGRCGRLGRDCTKRMLATIDEVTPPLAVIEESEEEEEEEEEEQTAVANE